MGTCMVNSPCCPLLLTLSIDLFSCNVEAWILASFPGRGLGTRLLGYVLVRQGLLAAGQNMAAMKQFALAQV